jgi:hypothetical protein
MRYEWVLIICLKSGLNAARTCEIMRWSQAIIDEFDVRSTRKTRIPAFVGGKEKKIGAPRSWPENLRRPSGRNQRQRKIRNSKSEILNKFKIRNSNVQNTHGHILRRCYARRVGRWCFEPLIFEIWICFGFRASDFEFQRCTHRARMLRLKTLTISPASGEDSGGCGEREELPERHHSALARGRIAPIHSSCWILGTSGHFATIGTP